MWRRGERGGYPSEDTKGFPLWGAQIWITPITKKERINLICDCNSSCSLFSTYSAVYV